MQPNSTTPTDTRADLPLTEGSLPGGDNCFLIEAGHTRTLDAATAHFFGMLADLPTNHFIRKAMEALLRLRLPAPASEVIYELLIRLGISPSTAFTVRRFVAAFDPSTVGIAR